MTCSAVHHIWQSPGSWLQLHRRCRVGFFGIGGSGKTVTSSWLAREDDIRQHFELILWITFGQSPNEIKMQQTIYRQLTGRDLVVDSTVEANKVGSQHEDILVSAFRCALPPRTLLPFVLKPPVVGCRPHSSTRWRAGGSCSSLTTSGTRPTRA